MMDVLSFYATGVICAGFVEGKEERKEKREKRERTRLSEVGYVMGL